MKSREILSTIDEIPIKIAPETAIGVSLQAPPQVALATGRPSDWLVSCCRMLSSRATEELVSWCRAFPPPKKKDLMGLCGCTL